jgi:cell division protein ZapA
MSAKNRVEVRIAGKDYKLIGSESDEYMQRIALYIDKKMNEIMRVNSKLSTSMAAVLTAINVADDFMKLREFDSNCQKELQQMKEHIQNVSSENERLAASNKSAEEKLINLQMELAVKDAELKEVRRM